MNAGRRPPTMRDARLALPVALLLVLVLLLFTLLTYRNGVRLLIADRQAEAIAAATGAGRRPAPRGSRLTRPGTLHPAAVRLAFADSRGAVLEVVGEPLPGPFAAPLGGQLPREPIAVGPHRKLSLVVAVTPLAGGGFVRLDLAAPALAGQQRTATVLTWVVSTISVAALLWLLLFVRQLLRPYETLLARARALSPRPGGPESDDEEAALLLTTVERALAEHRSAGEELAVLERTLAPSLESGLLLLDSRGAVLALNPSGAALLGPAPPPRTPLAELLATQPQLRAVLEEAVGGGQAVQRRETTVRRGDELRQVGLTVTPLRRGEGELLGFLVLFADLGSEGDASQQRLAESLAQLGELAAGVAHELRNGLATLSGYLSLLAREPHGEAARDCLAELRRETEHLQRVVTDFLGFARPETARPQLVDLEELVRHAAADPALPPDGVRLETTPGVTPRPLLSGDPQLLERALRNLLRNAFEAQQGIGDRRPLSLTTAWVEGGLVVTIADRGPGLPPEVRRRLFQPFAAGRPGGVGLGLALAHRIVAMHGGRLSLEDRPGGGTLARIAFPRERFQLAPPLPTSGR